MMIGLDCGSQSVKGILLKDGHVIARTTVPTEFDVEKAALLAQEDLVRGVEDEKDQIIKVAVTGSGRELITWADEQVNEMTASACGAHFIDPKIEVVISMGAESCHVLSLDQSGNVKKYESNDRCASGAGTFIEAMARALQIPVEEMGDRSLEHKKELVTNTQCVVFAESEVISLIHACESVEDIAYGIHMGIVNRIAALVRRIGMPERLMFIGGPGKNRGLIQCMHRCYHCEVSVPEHPEYVNALGAALQGGH